jgi:type IV pilus assembly protein PilV
MSLKRLCGRADDRSMRSGAPTLSDERGYTLVELLVAAFVLVVGMAGAFALLNGANASSVTNNARMGGTNLAREVLEDARSIDYDLLRPDSITTALQAKVGGSGSPWIVARRGIKYTLTVDVCTFDDPKDNIAATAPANVCTPQAPVPAAAGTLDPDIQPDDFRRVTVNLSWNTGRGNQTMKMVSLVNNPSGGLGPRITAFPDFSTQVTSGNTATVNAKTTNAGSLRWNSDGTPNGAGDATGGPTDWQATWQLGPAAAGKDPATANWDTTQFTAGSTVFDGTYTITGQAFDDRGIAGDSRASVLPLNRSAPITVTGFQAGRNFNTNRLEFSWNQSPELDIVGYKVFDLGPDDTIGNGNDSLICETPRVDITSCSGSSSMPSGNATYGVVALDWPTITAPGTGQPRTSTYAKGVATVSTQPADPTLLTVLPDLSLRPVLNWSHPSVGSVRFFRIYRITGTSGSCCAVADRYDLTSGNTPTSWTDPNPPATGTQVQYWVTAVGPGLNESTPSNAVTWTGL